MTKRKKKTNLKKQAPKKQKISSRTRIYWIAGILGLTFLVYLPLLKGGFISYDDQYYISGNSLITDFSFSGMKILFTSYFGNQYAPLAMSIMGLEFRIFGADPLPLKLISILIHLFNTFLVFRLFELLFSRMEYPIIVAGLFALHPIQVESIGWFAAAMKVPAFALFFLASLVCYLLWLKEKRQRLYWISLILFVLSCLCKEQAITLSVSLFAIDYLKGRKLTEKTVLMEKIPYLAVSLVFGLVTLSASSGIEPNMSVFQFSFIDRFTLSAFSIVAYIYQMLFPFKLSFMYFYPQTGRVPLGIYVSLIALVGLGYWFYYSLRHKKRGIAFGIAFFIINTGLVLVSQMLAVRDVMMADRYIYVSAIGIFTIMAYGYVWVARKKAKLLRPVTIGLGLYGLLLAVLTFFRAQVWENDITVFTDVIEKTKPKDGKLTPFLSLPLYSRGLGRKNQGDHAGAMEDYNLAVSINPADDKAVLNRGNLYFLQQQYNLAIEDYDKSISLNPKNEKAYSGRGAAYASIGQFEQALADFDKAVQLDPNFRDAISNRMLIYYNTGQYEAALNDGNRYLQLQPGNDGVINLRALAYQQLGRHREAEADFNRSILLSPNNGDYFLNRARFYYATNRRELAAQDAQKARSLGKEVPPELLQ